MFFRTCKTTVNLSVVILYGILGSANISAQRQPVVSEYAYRQYTTQDGLPKMYTECVFQDSQGFIWIGTLHGAVRYNGFQFEAFDLTRNAGITIFKESAKKNLMAFAFDAYYVFNYKTEKFTKKNYPDKLHVSELNSRLMPDGYAFFNHIEGDKEDKVLCRVAGEKVEPVLQNAEMNDMSNSQCPFFDTKTALLYLPCDLNSTIKIISLDGKLIFWQKMVRPYAIFQFKEKIYCIAESGVYRWNNQKFELLIQQHFPVSYGFVKVAVDLYGDLIISDLKNVFRLRNNRLERIFNGANLVVDICVDREGNLWLATYQGVFNLFRQQFKNYLLTDKKDMFRVIAGNPDKKGIITGTFDGKLISIKKSNSNILNYPNNPNGLFFENYCATLPDAVFLPSAGRVMKFADNRASWLNIPHQDYRCVASTPDGNLIAGWEKSFLLVSPKGKIISRFKSKDLKQFGQSRPCFDAQNNLYIGGDKGITKINKDTSILLTNPEFSSCWVVRGDNEGNIWGGAQRNLILVKNNKLIKIKELQGEIANIFFTKSNKMLVGTTKGIYIFDDLHKNFVFYDHLNGYTLAEPVRCDMYEDADANVWMPSVGGLACFNPDKLLTSQPTPVLHLLYAESSTDNIHFERLTAYTLSHKETNIRFHYIGLSYSQAQNVRYQYRLHGFQNEWSQPVAEREVTFNNLSPGKYTFELKCNAGTPETQTEAVSLPIYIQPAFWQTWWLKILLFLLLVGIIAWITIRYQRKKHEREIRKAEREKEMNELRIQSVRLKSIPHFNSNVLAGIEYLIMTKSKEDANQLLTTYSRFTNITLHDIDKAQRSLKDETDYVKMYLELEKMRYGDKLSYTIDVAHDVDKTIMIPNMVLHTYCENAIKHGIRAKNEAGKVKVEVKNEGKGVLISVEDNGVGREAASKSGLQSTKQGLYILNRQIELYNEQNKEKILQKIVDLKDETGKASGTKFELYVPYVFKYM